jgi:taurine dioxygenase
MAMIEAMDGCGAMVQGVDLTRASDGEVDAIRRAVFEHGVAFLRGQNMTPEQHIAFAERFGPIVVNRFFPKTEKHPQIAKVEKTADQTTNIGGDWHTDHSYDQAPAMGSILLARETPPSGGDTLFASMYAAYDALSDGFKAMLAPLKAHHAAAHVFGAGAAYAQGDQKALAGHSDLPEAIHPVVITHPGSGRKALYVNPAFTTGIIGWSQEESRALLHFLYAHAVQPNFVSRFQWQPGSVAIWDNRCSWHNAMNDYRGHYRLMHRITIAGEELH